MEIDTKLVKDIKDKSHSLHKLSLGSGSSADFEKLWNLKDNVSLKNIPNLLIQVFLNLPSTDPIMVAIAFLWAMYEYDSKFEEPKPAPLIPEDSSTNASAEPIFST